MSTPDRPNLIQQPYLAIAPSMTSLRKHLLRSDNLELLQQEASRLLFPVELLALKGGHPSEIEVAIATVGNMKLWRASSPTGYRVAYGCRHANHFELHFVETGHFTFKTSHETIEAGPSSAVLLRDLQTVDILAAPGSGRLAVSVPFNRFAAVVGRAGGDPTRALNGFRSVADVTPDDLGLSKQMATMLIGNAKHTHPFQGAPDGAMLLKDSLIATFIGLWPKSEPEVEPATNFPRHLTRAISWMTEHAGEDFSIEQLARSAGASVRSVQSAFRQHLSISPTTYLQRIRLSGAHDDLMYAEQSLSIEEVASRWGFGHMGYFASRYREMYDETPSQTRKRRP